MTDQLIDRVQLGALSVGAQGLGCMGMSEFYGGSDPSAARRTLERALERGVTLFDTADMYGRGENERFLSPFVSAHRDELTIATKFGAVRDNGPERVSNDPAYIRAAIDASLVRLGMERVDLYYMHRRDPAVPLADSVGTMAELVAAGKVAHLGLSEVTGQELREAHAIHPITAVQSEWSVFSRDVETTTAPIAAELGIGFVAYSPLGRGMLTGTLPAVEELGSADVRAKFPRFVGENGAHNLALVQSVVRIADDHGATPAQIALAWLTERAAAQRLTVVPIPGTRRPERLEENLGALAITLMPDEVTALDELAAHVHGQRYPDMSSTGAVRDQS